MQVTTYLYFDGRCDEALDFYRSSLGAEVTCLFRFKDSPDPTMSPPGGEDKVMHCGFRVGQTEILASDGHCTGQANFQGFALSLSPATVEEGERLFAALGDGGQVQMPLVETFFAARFGMVADRFGVTWMIVVPPKHQS
jgi:PhnB protein